MKILVTGGAGFIGSHLCRKLAAEGHDVVCLDNLFTGSMDNIADLIGKDKFEFLRHDVIEPIEMGRIDQIYNLACPASPVHYQSNPIKTMETNILGAINMLNLAKKWSARILQASTSEVYGDPLSHPQKENYWGNVNPIGIRSCYDEGKRAAETLFFDYHRQYGVAVKVVRIFNTYGPHMKKDDGRVVSNFVLQALEGKKITIYGNGSHTRSFCYVSDTVDGMIRMMNSSPEITGPINIGNPHETEVMELAKKILHLTGSDAKIVYQDLPEDDPRKRKPDITMAHTLLGWHPQVTLDEGLKETIQYFRGLVKDN